MGQAERSSDTTPIPEVTFADNHGNRRSYVFPATPAEPPGTFFALRPGGIIPPEGEWSWLSLFDVEKFGGRYELTVTGDPGQGGNGNYKGVWIDAFRLEDLSGGSLPRMREDSSLPGRWEGSFLLSPLSPRGEDLSLIVPAEEAIPAPPVLARRTFHPLLDARGRDHLAMWILVNQPQGSLQVALRDDRGQAVMADVCHLANDRPLRPGVWYPLLWPFRRSPADGPAPDWQRMASLEITAAPGTAVLPGTVCLHDPRLTTEEAARNELTASSGHTPAARDSLHRSWSIRDFPRQGVGAEKKVILWVHGGWGGMSNTAEVRRRIAELQGSGADGIVFTANPVVDGRELYFADQFFGPRRFTEQDFAGAFADLKAIRWGSLGHSLLRLNVMPGTVDWFDAEWDAITEKARMAARLAKAGELAGIMFDTEQYDWANGVFRYENRPL